MGQSEQDSCLVEPLGISPRSKKMSHLSKISSIIIEDQVEC